MDSWLDCAGLIALPSGIRVRGRRLTDPASPADRADALAALREAYQRACAGERVEAGCKGGTGRTGTALAALAILDGLTPAEAVSWVRRGYNPRAIETPWQRRWLRHVR